MLFTNMNFEDQITEDIHQKALSIISKLLQIHSAHEYLHQHLIENFDIRAFLSKYMNSSATGYEIITESIKVFG